jgi:protein-S-isoprenylcysteine O-methyltransferase Ste14
MIVLRSLVSIAVLPGIVAALVPWLVLRGSALAPFAVFALVPLAAGLALFAWCLVEFARRGRGTLAPWDAPRRFVASGPYRAVRNPMYVAVISVLVAEAIAFGSLRLALYAAFVGLAFHVFVLLYEEPTLERTFGESYRAYREAVPRWMPRRP